MAYDAKINWQNNEIVKASDMNRIEQGVADIDAALQNKVDKTQIKNNLTETVAGNVLDATQGKALKELLDELRTDRGYLTTVVADGADFDTLINNGKFKVTGGTNKPDDSTSSTFLLDVTMMNSQYVYQRAACLYSNAGNTGKTYERYKLNNTWGNWVPISAITPGQIGAETPTGAQAKVDAHNSQSNAHGATSAVTANKIIMRDSAGRAKVAAPSASDDIARKDTVDNHAGVTSAISTLGHVYEAELTATIATASWSGTTPPYSNAVTVNGITSSHNPIIDVTMSGTYSTDQQRCEQWGNIYRAVTSSNTITFYAHEKPTINLPIRVKVVA